MGRRIVFITALGLLLALPPAVAPVAAADGPFPAFRDCADCPEMVVLPAGEFVMGSREDEVGRHASEVDRHAARIAQPFAIMRAPVTVDDFRRFAEETGHAPDAACWTLTDRGWEWSAGHNWRAPGFDQGSDHPVTCVSFHDAQAYAAWLSARAEHTYRLPTEEEWEYAARGGTDGVNAWPDDASPCDHANINDMPGKNRIWRTAENCDDGFMFTSPIGSFPANGFGLYDMQGNVWEWTTGCWDGPPEIGADDGAPPLTGADGCMLRVLRGAAWMEAPGPVRLSLREFRPDSGRYSFAGFRLVRDFD
jgi:sulfatase modifying factor 1